MSFLTGKALAERLAPHKAPVYERHQFVPDFGRPVDNAQSPAPPAPPCRPSSVLLNTMRSSRAPDPAAREVGAATAGLPHSGFAGSIAEGLRGSAELRSARLWPCDAPRDAGAVEAEGTAAHGHQGLAWYVYACWAQEKGCVLRPDLVWLTVASELARETIAAPLAYRPLFASAAGGGKELVRVLVGEVDQPMPLERLASSVAQRMSDRRVAELVAHSDFASAGPGYHQAAASALAAAASPYYDYMTFMCGIPHFRIDGGSDEWQRLAAMCLELADHVTACNTPRTTQFAGYCRDVAGLVREVDAYAHCDMSVRANAEAAQTFFSACFWITASCGSGHPYYCRGWLSRLYFVKAKEPEYREMGNHGERTADGDAVAKWARVLDNVLDFPTHMGRVAWRNEESGRMFCMCTGLFYSTLSDDGVFLLPCYGQLQYEIRDEGLFKLLAN
eukprot:m51a1_g4704 hypothetical protein (446) ;mRNA; r:247833-249291